jgi:hypothetical protein
MNRVLLLAPVLLLVGLVLTACDDDDDDDGGGDGGGATTVNVELNEFVITADPESAPAGEVTFEVENIGEETHEFVIVQTDLDADELPAAEDGSFDEEGEGVTVVDEIEDIESGATADVTANLEAGAYLLICNLVEEEDGETESHFAEGMHTGFTVE